MSKKPIICAVPKWTHRSDEEILEILALQKESGLSISAFCEKHRLTEPTFRNWYKQRNRVPQEGTFIPVHVQENLQEEHVSGECIWIRYTDGTQVRLPHGQGHLLEALLPALRR